MPLDREATLRQAEKFLRQGRLDGAIAEYVRLIEAHPRDWNAINALGDLYVRAGDAERAVAQFTRVGDYLFGEGFLPKAQALYKKALKAKGDHEHTLLRLSEIATQQGLLADARLYLRQLGRQRGERGDTRGAAECLVRLASLDEADAAAKQAGARAARELGDTVTARAFFIEAADALERNGQTAEAMAALSDAAAIDPLDTLLRGRLARGYVAAGELEKAGEFLTLESAGADPDLLLALGRRELGAGNDADARSILTRFLAVAPDRWRSLLTAAGELSGTGSVDAGYFCVEVVVEDALLRGDWDRAIDAVKGFAAHGAHIPALARLIELAVDSGRDSLLAEVQPQLADAYLAAGRGTEARVIAEDLVSREPQSDVHVDRLRRALAMLGVGDVEAVIAGLREPQPDLTDVLDLPEPDIAQHHAAAVETDGRLPEPAADAAPALAPGPALVSETAHTAEPAPAPAPAPAPEPADPVEPVEPAPVSEPARASTAASVPEDEPIVLDTTEIDLTDVLAGIDAVSPSVPAAPDPPSGVATPPPLESVFEEMRARAARDHDSVAVAEQYERALEHLEHGRLAEGIADLQGAARAPMFRFQAASRLGRLLIARGDTGGGIEWLRWAAETPPPTPEEGYAVRYELASAFEQAGETGRALAIFMQIDADSGSYRDVRSRIDQLARLQAGSPNR